MNTKRLSWILAAVCVMVLFVPQAQAQGIFTRKGFGAEAGYSNQKDINTLNAEVGYVLLNGAGEFGVGIARASEEESGLDINATGITPYVAVYPVRQSASFPLSLRLLGSYTIYNFSGTALDELKDLGADFDGSGYELGGQFFHTFTVSPKVKIVPRAGISYVAATLNVVTEDIEGNRIKEKETNDFEVITLATSFAFQPRGRAIVTVTPRLNFADGEEVFGISTGLVLPMR